MNADKKDNINRSKPIEWCFFLCHASSPPNVTKPTLILSALIGVPFDRLRTGIGGKCFWVNIAGCNKNVIQERP